jgi:hypothetical protein
MYHPQTHLPQGFTTNVRLSNKIVLRVDGEDIVYPSASFAIARAFWWHPAKDYVAPPRPVDHPPTLADGGRYYFGPTIEYGTDYVDHGKEYTEDKEKFEKLNEESSTTFGDCLISEALVAAIGCTKYPVTLNLNSRSMGYTRVTHKVVVLLELDPSSAKIWYMIAYVVPHGYILDDAGLLIGSNFINAYVKIDESQGLRLSFVDQNYQDKDGEPVRESAISEWKASWTFSSETEGPRTFSSESSRNAADHTVVPTPDGRAV